MTERTTTSTFSILRRTKQKLNDLSRFLTGTSSEPSGSSTGLKPIPKRRSREQQKQKQPVWCPIPSTSSTSSNTPGRRHHSLTSMKTYYAFGARSHSAGISGRSYSSYNIDTNPANDYESRRYTSRNYGYGYVPSTHIPRMTSTNLESSVESANGLIAKYCRSPTVSSISTGRTSGYGSGSSIGGSPNSSNSYRSASSSGSSIYSTMRNRETVEFKLPKISSITELRQALSEDRPRASRTRWTSEREERDEFPTNHLTLPEKTDRATSASLENLNQNSIEVDDLKKKNQFLEEEIARLKLLLRDKDRTEHELRRRLLEVEAEAKVWRTKCEHLQPKLIQITEPAFDRDLLEKLDSATEKLAKLNMAGDLRMLQAQMETALHEIQPQ
ncbi:unnamed protein product, partial [Mesorhabditis belari]|uniref:Uncharacterized protein n=1 Tax=Mesorhabditis belari TaxID=2138241 RepID=A0AAF3FJC2_9BILA